MKIKTGLYICLVTSVFFGTVGCASKAVKDSDLEQNTSFALGLDQDQFTISNRVDSGVTTNYVVKTKSGKNYRCYVTGTFSIMGPAVSDAICSNSNGTSSSKAMSGTACNALLKAAGKC